MPLLADSLRRFHAIDPAGYRMPFARDQVARRIAAGQVSVDGFHGEHRGLDQREALARFDELTVAETDLVVCHGDRTPPNALLGGPGRGVPRPR